LVQHNVIQQFESTVATIFSEMPRQSGKGTGGYRHVVVNSLGDNGFEFDPLVRDAAAGVSAVT
jgi:hypothetical protein